MSAPVEGQPVRLMRGHEGWDLETTETCTPLTVNAGMRQQDALRLAACWNACQGIPTEALERVALARSGQENESASESALSDARRLILDSSR